MALSASSSLSDHYNSLAHLRDWYRQKNRYYYELLHKEYRYFVPKGKKVLEVGCGTGELLNVLEPSIGVGIDLSHKMAAAAHEKFPHLQFFAGEVKDLLLPEKFDYVILSGLLGEVQDIQQLLLDLKRFCHPQTRIIIEYYSYFWQYLLKMGEKWHMKIPQRIQNWVTHEDVLNFLTLAGYEDVRWERSILCPQNIWGVSYILNRFVAKLPIINALTLNHFVIARPIFSPMEDFSVTIVVPCRNEKGNIEQAVTRTPSFGKHQEFIFVEGGSKDGTYEEVERIIQKYFDKDIKLFKQVGRGKADAVRVGFGHATGDILMILDADLTVAPEDLPKFYDAIRSNRGEFINGCRLVYPMEKEAMRFLNMLANKFFGIFFSWLLGQRFKDTLCGTKVLFKDQYQEIAANRAYFGDFDPFGDFDLIFGAVKLNLKVLELPIRYRERTYGTTQIRRFYHGLLLFKMCGFAMKKIKFR
ncbi:MAG: glycosyltransferase [Candidatus Omnitrophica bacterium]|nr:glycosyltransferase [Candidatus Omnitrophota bacterium]